MPRSGATSKQTFADNDVGTVVAHAVPAPVATASAPQVLPGTLPA